ncbi:hypothetical protein Tco_0480414 [Tanacetum coccineum]
MRILSVVSVKIEKKSGYGYLEEIVVRRADQKLYKFKEGDFPDLHLNDIEDMLLLIAQNKLFNLEDVVIVDFVTALKMFTRRISIQNKVEDVQLDVQKKNYEKLKSAGWWKKNTDGQTTIAEDRGSFPKDENIKTKTELTLEQTQQGVSDEVLNIRVMLHTIHSEDGNPTSANIKQALRQDHVKIEMKTPRSSKVKFITA